MGAESVPQVLDDAAICMEASSIFWHNLCALIFPFCMYFIAREACRMQILMSFNFVYMCEVVRNSRATGDCFHGGAQDSKVGITHS